MKGVTQVRSLSAIESSSETNVLTSKRREAQIQPVGFDATVRRILSRQETQAGDFPFRAEVNDQRVRMTRVGRREFGEAWMRPFAESCRGRRRRPEISLSAPRSITSVCG